MLWRISSLEKAQQRKMLLCSNLVLRGFGHLIRFVRHSYQLSGSRRVPIYWTLNSRILNFRAMINPGNCIPRSRYLPVPASISSSPSSTLFSSRSSPFMRFSRSETLHDHRPRIIFLEPDPKVLSLLLASQRSSSSAPVDVALSALSELNFTTWPTWPLAPVQNSTRRRNPRASGRSPSPPLGGVLP